MTSNPTDNPKPADQTRTGSVYALQWNRFRIVRPEEDRVTFLGRTRFSAQDLAGKRVLDAGCGMGRYARVADELGARVVGLDLSDSVVAARELNPGPGIARFVKGDLLRLPFRAESFDAIYSIGVLDHTPNPKAAFLGLAQLLAPGGRIAVWVYRRERPILEFLVDCHRAISTRLPMGLVLFLARLSAPIGGLKRGLMSKPNRFISRLGVLLNLLTLGVSMHPDPEVRICDTFDWYAPKYMSRHSLDEVLAWFREAGLIEIEDLSLGQTHFHAGQGNGINVAAKRRGE